MEREGALHFRHGMSTSLLEHQYAGVRRMYRCFWLAPLTLGFSLILGLMAGHIARPDLCPRFVRHVDYLHRTLVIFMAAIAFVFGGWVWTEYISGMTGLFAGLSGAIVLFGMRLVIGGRALDAMYQLDFPDHTADAST